MRWQLSGPENDLIGLVDTHAHGVHDLLLEFLRGALEEGFDGELVEHRLLKPVLDFRGIQENVEDVSAESVDGSAGLSCVDVRDLVTVKGVRAGGSLLGCLLVAFRIHGRVERAQALSVEHRN